MPLNHRKDEKIQLYRAVKRQVSGTTRTEWIRQFIYTEDVFLSGGIYANAREMKDSEVVTSGLQIGVVYRKFTVNRNPLIKEDLKIIYRGEVYDITPPIDNFDGRTREITFNATKTSDTNKYTGDEYAD